jgi:hypothetical protein
MSAVGENEFEALHIGHAMRSEFEASRRCERRTARKPE